MLCGTQGNLEIGEEEVVEILLKLQDTQLSAAVSASAGGAAPAAHHRRGHHAAAAVQVVGPPANGRRYGTRMAAGRLVGFGPGLCAAPPDAWCAGGGLQPSLTPQGGCCAAWQWGLVGWWDNALRACMATPNCGAMGQIGLLWRALATYCCLVGGCAGLKVGRRFQELLEEDESQEDGEELEVDD